MRLFAKRYKAGSTARRTTAPPETVPIGQRSGPHTIPRFLHNGISTPDRDERHRIAESGAAGDYRRLPFLHQIQQSFGPGHDLGRVKAHVGGQASTAARSLGTEAYTVGDHVVFGSTPSLQVAAHEAAHVVQQRLGTNLGEGFGQAGDGYERNADAVASRVEAGRSTRGYLPNSSPGHCGGAGVGGRPVQTYTVVSGKPYDRLSDDGKMAVKDHKKDAWAPSSKIKSSNKVLDRLKSQAKIEELSGSDITVTAPNGSSSRTLKKFRMVNRITGAEASLTDDCGTAAQEMLGSGAAGFESFVSRNIRGTNQEYTGSSSYVADDNAPGGSVSTTEKLSGEIYIRIMKREFKKTLGRVDAVKEWAKLSAAKKKVLSKKYGINQFAVPNVGQGITIGSERDIPGGGSAAVGSGSGYNFHFGLNLMASDHDYITLEDYHLSGVAYYFDMYGPTSKAQSWADAPSNINALGAKTTTMVVQHPESLKGTVNTNGTFFEADPGKPKQNRTLTKNTKITIIRRGHSWMKVRVKSGTHTGKSGWILNRTFSGT